MFGRLCARRGWLTRWTPRHDPLALGGPFAQRFPRVQLDREVLYVADDRVITAASLDCCLHLVRCDQGAEVAARVARRMVVAPRQGGQAQFIEQPVLANAEGDHLQEVLDWACAHLDRVHTLDTLAKRAHMRRRSFTRRFRTLTGTSVSPWLAAQRVALAQRLLETSEASVEQLAESVGFGSPLSLRQHFAAQLRTSPTQYRRAFRA